MYPAQLDIESAWSSSPDGALIAHLGAENSIEDWDPVSGLHIQHCRELVTYLQSAGAGRVREDADDEHAEHEDEGQKHLRETP